MHYFKKYDIKISISGGISMKKLGLFGCGYLAHIIADCYLRGELEGYEIVGCFSRGQEHRALLAEKLKIKACNTYDELLDLNLDYIIEATNPKATKEIILKTLHHKTNLILLSIGALSNEKFLEEAKQAAIKNGVRIHIANGAMAGFEAIRTAKLMHMDEAELVNVKGVGALRGNGLYKPEMEEKEIIAFKGSAEEAIESLPTGINVGVATALASLGVKKTKITVISRPNFIGDIQTVNFRCNHEIEASLSIYSETSSIAGYSVVALLQNLISPIVF